MSYLLVDLPNPFTPQYGYPRRGATPSGTIIIHTAECAMDLAGPDDSAENCANFIRNRTDYGSYHDLVDSDSILELVPYDYEAWQDSQTNPWAIGISAAVQANGWHLIPADRRDRIYRNMAAAAAKAVRYMKARWGITVPIRRITGPEARARVPGFCAHGDSGLYRTDPGTQFDWALFFAYTRLALDAASPQSTPSEKEAEVPAYKRLTAPMKHRRLAQGQSWFLKDKTGNTNENYAAHGAGLYDVKLLMQGTDLPAGEFLTVQFYLVTAGKRSGYYTQRVTGNVDGRFKGHAVFAMPVGTGQRVEVSVTSSKESAYLDVYAAEVCAWAL